MCVFDFPYKYRKKKLFIGIFFFIDSKQKKKVGKNSFLLFFLFHATISAEKCFSISQVEWEIFFFFVLRNK